MKDSFIFYTKYEEQISLLSDAQAGVLLRALIAYQSNKELPEMDAMTNIVFTVIRQQIDFDSNKYEEICKTNKANGRLGGRPSKSVRNQGEKPKKPNGFRENQTDNFETERFFEKPKKPEYEYESDYDTDNDIEERKKEIYKNNNLTPCACEEEDESENDLISHEDIMRDYGISKWLTETLKDFLRHCYLNGHIVTNAKLEDIIFRLIEKYGQDNDGMIDCVNRAISGGYFDVKA